MNFRSFFVYGAFLLFASVTYGAGSYQRTRDGHTRVWNDSPEAGEEATWSGKSDKEGFATGPGILTWYKAEPRIVTGSNILDTRRYAMVISRCSGKMMRGKFKGPVIYIDANGGTQQVTSVNGADRPTARQKSARVRTTKRTAAPTAEGTDVASQQTVMQKPERVSTPAPEHSPSPMVEEPETAVSSGPAMLAGKAMASPPSEQQARQPDPQSTTALTPKLSGDSLRSHSEQPLDLPKPPRTTDMQTVAQLDAVYQAAVKANDVAIMNEILADDFVLVTDRGASLTKADLIKEAQEKRTIYEYQDVEQGTRKVRIWRDTAVVTALVRIKGMKDQNPFDYKVWLNQTYVRTPTGWHYVFGQALKPDAK